MTSDTKVNHITHTHMQLGPRTLIDERDMAGKRP